MSRKPRGFAKVLLSRSPFYSDPSRDIEGINAKAMRGGLWKDSIRD